MNTLTNAANVERSPRTVLKSEVCGMVKVSTRLSGGQQRALR